MQVNRIDYNLIEMMFRGRRFCTLSLSIENKDKKDKVEIKRQGDKISFLFKNGDFKELPFDEAMEIIKKLKPLLKDLKDNLTYCNILNCCISLKYKEIKK